MKRNILIVLILQTVFPILNGCVISKRSTDRSVINYIKKKPALIKECAEYAISIAFENNVKEFEATNIKDKAVRHKISSLGSSVDITYRENNRISEIPDSMVTFKSITLFGVTEVVYDFASAERHFADDVSNRQQYYFVKVADRVYYRRRPVPIM